MTRDSTIGTDSRGLLGVLFIRIFMVTISISIFQVNKIILVFIF
jgi:hypothetical protein